MWPQIFADVLDVDVEVPAAGRAAELEEATTSLMRIARRYQPNPTRRDAYLHKFARVEALASALGSTGRARSRRDAGPHRRRSS